MKIVHYNNIDFTIDSQGNISRTAIWHVMEDSNVVDSWTGLPESAKTWAGTVGDPWRLPGQDSQSYTEDENYVISEIQFQSKSRFEYEITYTGVPRYTEAEMISVPSLTINENGEKQKDALFKVHTDNLENFLPETGDVMIWAGELYCCSDIKVQGDKSGVYDVQITAKDVSFLLVGNVSYRKNNKFEQIKTATFSLDNDTLDEKLTLYDIGEPADWAGEGYYITDQKASPNGKIGYKLELEAKHISVRLISIKKQTSFKRFDDNGGAVNEVVYTGTWQVHKDNIDDFNAMSGQSAAEWAEDGYTITEIDPVFISEFEYEVTLRASNLDESGTGGLSFDFDISDDIKSGKPVYTTLCTDFHITPEMAGWKKDPKTNILKKFNDIKKKDDPKWDPSKDCPFVTKSEMAKGWANKVIPSITLKKVEYLKGEPAKHINSLYKWKHIEGQVSSIKKGSLKGCWRKLNIDAERVKNSSGDIYTRITKTYQEAPGKQKWNSGWIGLGDKD